MTGKTVFAPALLCTIIMLTSCAGNLRIEKKRYRPGFFVDWQTSCEHEVRPENNKQDKPCEQKSLVHPDDQKSAQQSRSDTAAFISTDSLFNQRLALNTRSYESCSINPESKGNISNVFYHSQPNRTATDLFTEILIIFFLFLLSILFPGLIVMAYAAYVSFRWNDTLAAVVFTLSILLFIAQLVAIILLIMSSPLWLPLFIITAGIGLIFFILGLPLL